MSSEDTDSSSADDESYSSSSDSEYRSKHKRKKKASKHDEKHRKRHHKKHKSKHKEKSKHKSKSKRKHKHKHKHDREKRSKRSDSKKRHRTDDEQADRKKHDTESQRPHKKRKLTANPCTVRITKQMIKNAKTVLTMLCENDHDDAMKQIMIDVFTKLDHHQSVSLYDHNASFEHPLKMIFTFLALHTNDDVTYSKPADVSMSLLSTFKKELKLQSPSKSDTECTAKASAVFIGPAMPPSNYQRCEPESAAVLKAETNDAVPVNSGIIGVTMPTQADLVNNKYSSDEDEDDEDIIGPARIHKAESVTKGDCKRLLQMEHTRIYAEMNKAIKGDDENTGNAQKENEAKRPEWMTSMPQTLISDFDKGTKGRGFSQKEHQLDTSWEQTPGDLKKQKQEKKRIEQIQQRTNERLKAIGLPTVDERDDDTLAEMGKAIESMADENGDRMRDRKKSLFEVHQEKLREEYKTELKEWKRKKKNGEKVGAKPVFKGVEMHHANAQYAGSMDSYYNAQNPVFTRSKLNTFVCGGSIDNY